MASSLNFADEPRSGIEAHLACTICYNLLREPKDLDCPHVFCLECLQQWAEKRPSMNNDSIECPECRHTTTVPQGGLVNLKTNLRLKNMIEEYSTSHNRQNLVPFCPNHKGERQHFFCVTCNVTVCRDCLVLEHMRPQHEIKELKAVVEMRKAELEAKTSQVGEEIQKGKRKLKDLDYAEREMNAAEQQALRDIKKRAHDIIAEVVSKEKEMIKRVKTTYEEHKNIFDEKQNDMKDKVAQLQNVHAATRDLLDTAPDHVCVRKYKTLVGKMDDGLKIKDVVTPDDLGSLHFRAGPGPVNPSWFGDVMIRGNKVCGLKLVQEFGPFECASGVAVNQAGLIAVVDRLDDKVSIHREVGGEYKHQFCLGYSSQMLTITKPIRVAVTSQGEFFVTDSRNVVDEFVTKVFSSSGEYKKTVAHVGNRITITSDDMIVTSNSKTGVIAVHQSDGKLIRKHRRASFKNVTDITSNGKQIVFTTYHPDQPENDKLCAVDLVTGQIIWSVNIYMPGGVCYEPTSNTILVGAGPLHRGVLYQVCSTTGRLISRLEGGFVNPLKLTMTHDNRLLVADQG